MAVRIKAEEFEEKVLKSEIPVLVDFYSDSCVACKKIAPALRAAEDQLSQKVNFYKVNTNFEEALAEQFEILSQPTLALFKDGKEQDRKSEILKPEALVAWLELYLV
ncbi:thioredoxin family protein [bacterium 210820-DFI.6.37]|nr:thioredoxin family protein [bacterium 210820-DFI.6.37]